MAPVWLPAAAVHAQPTASPGSQRTPPHVMSATPPGHVRAVFLPYVSCTSLPVLRTHTAGLHVVGQGQRRPYCHGKAKGWQELYADSGRTRWRCCCNALLWHHVGVVPRSHLSAARTNPLHAGAVSISGCNICSRRTWSWYVCVCVGGGGGGRCLLLAGGGGGGVWRSVVRNRWGWDCAHK